MDASRDGLLLREDRIIATVVRLQKRITDRFPDSGLANLCGELHAVAEQATERAAWIGNPIRKIRFAGYLSALMLILFFVTFVVFEIQATKAENVALVDLVGAIEAGLNVVIFFFLAIWFLISLETRIKRKRAIASVHQLRSLAHVVDMHQLTKDPERVLTEWMGTENSPAEEMSPRELNRYLDYCSEMLSLIGKIASLYVQRFDDAEAVAAVSEVEQLTTGLSRKIWQKIMILNQSRNLQLQAEPPVSDVRSQPQPTERKVS